MIKATTIIGIMIIVILALFYNEQPLNNRDTQKTIIQLNESLANTRNNIIQTINIKDQANKENRENLTIITTIAGITVDYYLTIAQAVMPYIIILTAGELNKEIIQLGAIIIGLWLIMYILNITKLIIIIYFFIKEKKKNKEKWYK